MVAGMDYGEKRKFGEVELQLTPHSRIGAYALGRRRGFEEADAATTPYGSS